MKIDFKHRNNLYLNCNHTSSVYRCNNVNVSFQQPTCASSQNQQLPTVTDQCMHIESYQNLLLSYSIECDHHIDHNETYYATSECTDELFFKIVNRSQLLLNTI